jgi:hypothetical protein
MCIRDSVGSEMCIRDRNTIAISDFGFRISEWIVDLRLS